MRLGIEELRCVTGRLEHHLLLFALRWTTATLSSMTAAVANATALPDNSYFYRGTRLETAPVASGGLQRAPAPAAVNRWPRRQLALWHDVCGL